MTEKLNETGVLDTSSRVENFVPFVLIKVNETHAKRGVTCKADIVDNIDFLQVNNCSPIHLRDRTIQVQVNDVARYIVRWLESGPRPRSEIVSDATSIGYNEKTVRRAIRSLMDMKVIVSVSVPTPGRPAAREYRLSQVTQ